MSQPFRSLRSRLRTLEKRTPIADPADQERRELEDAKRAFLAVCPTPAARELAQRQAILATVYAYQQDQALHPESTEQARRRRGPIIAGPTRTPESIATEWEEIQAELDDMVRSWLADGAPGAPAWYRTPLRPVGA